MPWSTSTRRQQLPSDWATTRRRILRRDHHTCQHPHCDQVGTDVDHINRGAGDDDTNLQALCADHHRAKTLSEAQAAMAAARAKARHPEQRHPGLR